MATISDLFIIGAGVAGLTAADHAARAGLSVTIAEQLMFGGLVVNVNHLWPGLEGQAPSGSDLAAELMTRVSDAGVATVFEQVTALEPHGEGLRIATACGEYLAKAAIVASGANLRALGIPGEAEFEHRGVSHCADCDAPLFEGQDVVVVGGGNSALQEALVLASFCSRVHLVHRNPGFTARGEFAERVRATANIALHLETIVESVEGADQVTGVRVRHASGQQEFLPCTGFFAYVGLEPNTAWVPSQVQLEGGSVVVDERLETTLPGLFAIGAARKGYGGMLKDAVADAQRAAEEIVRRHAGRGT